MGTTTNGITYPDPSGVPSRNALQGLATSVDAAVFTDTGWLTLANQGTGGLSRYRVKQGVVYVQLNVTISISSGATTTVVTAASGLPAAYRPSAVVFSGAAGPAALGYFQVNADGSISAHATTGALTVVTGTASYPVG